MLNNECKKYNYILGDLIKKKDMFNNSLKINKTK